ncbi:MAG: type III-B CRISPR module RAMP protein Cmr6 [Verrucomicrobiae bacterium]|nr:type III-B CRISPR module RAMP protein Cmr6 [Verrucomicrobiae bacterium]
MITITKPVKEAIEAMQKRCDAWHLWLDKIVFNSATAKTDALKEVRNCYKKSAPPNLSLVCRAKLRFLECLAQQHGKLFQPVDLKLASRLLVHLGRPSILENVGLYFDRTTGLPQIPGTALKGLLSTWACWANFFNPSDGSIHLGNQPTTRANFTAGEARLARQILGDDSADGSEHAGGVVFIGGFPLEPPSLGLDIVNPHHEPNGNPKDRLTPNTFLCIEPETIWRFAFYLRPGLPDPDQLIATTKRWIEEALTQLGIGAKTSAGYGRFQVPTPDDLAAASRRTEAVLPAEQARRSTEAAQQQAAARGLLSADYPNQATFDNRVIKKLAPGTLDQLQSEIPILQKPENAGWLDQLKKTLASKEYKDIRKRLRDKDWFPKQWLPQQ